MGILDSEWPYVPIDSMALDEKLQELHEIHDRMCQDPPSPSSIQYVQYLADPERYQSLQESLRDHGMLDKETGYHS